MTRDLATVRAHLRERAIAHRGPFEVTSIDEVDAALAALRSLEPDHWADTWMPFGDQHALSGEHLVAANYYRVARYPFPRSDGKRLAYRRSVESYLAAARTFDPPLRRIEIPSGAMPVVGYLREPTGGVRAPLLITRGGIDSYEEDRRTDRFLSLGIATLAIDMPGTGELPAVDPATVDAMWDALLAWAGARGSRWHLRAEHRWLLGRQARPHAPRAPRLRGRAWRPDPSRVRRGVDPLGPRRRVPVRACGVPGPRLRRWHDGDGLDRRRAVAVARRTPTPRPSVLPDIGAERASDSVFPIADLHELLEHGGPKVARVFGGGHMGPAAQTEPVVAEWVAARLVRR